ncbi:MAG: hypothetical protein APR63_07050 [Desulfuromonas sp. SDB]|nr:MAG: hypothetical protein APR63_07050 [Desulfuromonas sp. SDB]
MIKIHTPSLKLVLPVFITISVLLSCWPVDNQNSKSRLESDQISSLEFQSEYINQSYAYSENDPGAVIEITYIEITKAPSPRIRDAINEQLEDIMIYSQGFESYQQLMDSFITEYRLYYESNADDPLNIGWEDQRTVEVIYNYHNIFSVGCNFYSFTGGAHPNGWTDYYNFDIQTGEVIDLQYLFSYRETKKLQTTGENLFRDMYGIRPDENFSDYDFWFPDDEFYLTENFFIDDQGLTFYYNSYEIAPYSSGPTELHIPYELIVDLIDQDNILYPITN